MDLLSPVRRVRRSPRTQAKKGARPARRPPPLATREAVRSFLSTPAGLRSPPGAQLAQGVRPPPPTHARLTAFCRTRKGAKPAPLAPTTLRSAAQLAIEAGAD